MRVILTCIVIAAMAGFFSSVASSAYSGPYALLAPVAVDGDTINADVPLWPGVTADDVSIRVLGVDTPEITGSKCAEEKAAGILAKAFTDAWITKNYPIVVVNVKPDKYSGRFDAIVTGSGGERLSAALIQAGHGRPYNGGARQSWCP